MIIIHNSEFPPHRQAVIIHNSRRGFTLIELLVSIAVFSIVVSIAVGGFTRALRTERQVAALIAANSNASLVVEQIAREIRTGSNFSCSGVPCTELSFVNARAENVTYRLLDGAIEKRETDGVLFGQITAENINVHYLFFDLFENPAFPPRITIRLGVSAREVGVQGSVTRIQTTVSAR